MAHGLFRRSIQTKRYGLATPEEIPPGMFPWAVVVASLSLHREGTQVDGNISHTSIDMSLFVLPT